MKRWSSLLAASAFAFSSLFAQTSDLVFFTDDGAGFVLVVDGDKKNTDPASRVVATGVRNETPMVIISFENGTIPDLRKSGYFPLGKEYTIMITTNKKGEKVLRMTGEAALGTAAKTQPAQLVPDNFVDDPAVPTNPNNATFDTNGGGLQTTQTTVVEESTNGDGEKVSMSVGFNGIGFDMDVNVQEGGGNTSTTTTTTTTTTKPTTTAVVQPKPKPVPAPVPAPVPVPVPEPVYSMPGYTGAVGCPWPMNDSEFASMKNSISSKNFEDSKMTVAKQMLKDRCMTVSQVKGFMGLFTFEDSKLDFAKFAYDHTYDIGNYYQVNDQFTFETTIDELNQYLESK